MKRFTATISYKADVVIGEGQEYKLQQNLIDFGATDVTVVLSPWTGSGTHEWVTSNTFGMQDRQVCIKCLKARDKAGLNCPGIVE